MRDHRLALLTLVLGLALGAMLGSLAGREPVLASPQLLPHAEAPGPLSEGAPAAEPLTPLTLSGRRAAARASSPSPAALQASAEEATRGALARLDAVPRVAEGTEETGVITGLVINRAGTPISGVRVVASRYNSARSVRTNLGIGREWPGARTLTDELTEQAVQLAAQRAGQRTTLTDDAGRFRIAEIVDGSYRLEAFKEGVEFKHAGANYGRHGGRLWRAGSNSARIIGTPTQSVHLDVRLEDGTALDEARLEVRYETRDPFHPGFIEWTRGAAALQVSSRPGRIRALAHGPNSSKLRGAPRELASEWVSFGPGAPQRGLVLLEVRPRGLLGVRVEVVDDTASILDHQINVRVEGPHGDVGELIARAAHWWFEGVSPGQVTIKARRQGQAEDIASATASFDGRWGTERLAVDVPAPVIVSCIGPDGTLPCDVTFQLRGPKNRTQLQARLRAPGEYAMAVTPKLQQLRKAQRSLSASLGTQLEGRGNYTLVGQSGLLGEVHAPVTEETSTVTLAFDPPASLLLTIAVEAPTEFRAQLDGLADDGVKSGWRHLKRRPRLRSGQPAPLTFEADGTLLLTGLQPGVHLVTVSSERERSYILPGADDLPRDPITVTAALSIQAGKNVHEVTIPERFELQVHAPDHPVGTTLRLRSTDPPPGSDDIAGQLEAALNDQHGAVIERVPRGTYSLLVNWRDGSSRREVTVPGPAITLKRTELRGFRITRVRPGGLAVSAGLRNGDLLVEVDGQPVDSRSMERLRLDVGRRQPTLTVERDGARHELQLGLGDPGEPAYGQLRMYFEAVED